MDELKKKIRENKPDISESSVNSYANVLRHLFYKEHLAKVPLNMEFFNDIPALKEAMKDHNVNTRKTTYAAILTLHKGNDEIKKLMNTDWNDVKEVLSTNEKNDKQKENWMEYDEIKSKVSHQIKLTRSLFASKEVLTQSQYKDILMTMILQLTTGYYEGLPPRRNQDWNELMFKNYDDKTDNYITKTHFVFNRYKTAKVYGEDKIEIPKELKPFINNFLRHRKAFEGDYLLYSPTLKDGRFSGDTMGQSFLNKFFGKKIGTSMLRHIYISSIIDIKKMKENAENMGHSLKEQLQYAKL